MTAAADLTTLGDVDWYQFKSNSKPGGVTVQLRTAGLSLLSARVSVYDNAGRLLASTDAGGEPGRDLQLRLDQLPSGSTYFVKVERATNNVFGIGGYRLEVSTGSSAAQVTQQPTPTRTVPDLGTTFDAALSLQQKIYRTDARFDYAYSGTSDPGTVRYFRLKAPEADAGTPSVLTIMTWATQLSGGQPLLTVYDAAGNPVNADILVRENRTFVVQVRNTAPNAQYVVAVQAGVGQGASDYFLGADFGTQAAQLDTLVDSQGLAPGTVAEGTLHIDESRLFHFVLSAASTGDATAVVRLDILDAAGNLVSSLTAPAGQSLSTTLLLGPGDYTFRFTTDSPSGAPVAVTLQSQVVDDPIGPELADPTLAPLAPTGTTSATTSTSYVCFWQISYYTFLTSVSTSLSPTTN